MEIYKLYMLTTPEEEGGYSTIVLNLPGAGSCGETEEESIENAKEATIALLHSYTENNEVIPWKPIVENVEGAKWVTVRFHMDNKPVLGTKLPPIPINACWLPGPVNGNDPVERDLVEVGDTFLVLVHCVDRNFNTDFWDAHVIVATETGWDDTNGDSWSAWDWSDVSWYFELTKQNMPQL